MSSDFHRCFHVSRRAKKSAETSVLRPAEYRGGMCEKLRIVTIGKRLHRSSLPMTLNSPFLCAENTTDMRRV
jgi:hypothetical protein